MANPRRNSIPINTQFADSDIEIANNPFHSETLATKLSRFKFFFKRPLAFPFLLLIFLVMTWVFLRIQQHNSQFSSSQQRLSSRSSSNQDQDRDANLVRFPSSPGSPSPITKDKRGWLVDPVVLAQKSGLSGGALICASLHVGEIRPGGLRGNHRHHTCNETFLIWGAQTLFRMENTGLSRGYAEITVGADEVAVAVSPSGTAHALVNVDPARTTFFLGCQDSVIDYDPSTSDFKVWKDL